jgi:hypothetical protein
MVHGNRLWQYSHTMLFQLYESRNKYFYLKVNVLKESQKSYFGRTKTIDCAMSQTAKSHSRPARFWPNDKWPNDIFPIRCLITLIIKDLTVIFETIQLEEIIITDFASNHPNTIFDISLDSVH